MLELVLERLALADVPADDGDRVELVVVPTPWRVQARREGHHHHRQRHGVALGVVDGELALPQVRRLEGGDHLGGHPVAHPRRGPGWPGRRGRPPRRRCRAAPGRPGSARRGRRPAVSIPTRSVDASRAMERRWRAVSASTSRVTSRMVKMNPSTSGSDERSANADPQAAPLAVGVRGPHREGLGRRRLAAPRPRSPSRGDVVGVDQGRGRHPHAAPRGCGPGRVRPTG